MRHGSERGRNSAGKQRISIIKIRVISNYYAESTPHTQPGCETRLRNRSKLGKEAKPTETRKGNKDILEKLATALKIPVEAIKNFNEDAVVTNISCTFHDSPNSASVIYNFNPIEKWIEALEENKRLNQTLLKEKDERIALLERLINQNK